MLRSTQVSANMGFFNALIVLTAAYVVAAETIAGVPLFDYEKIQLTDHDVAQLSAEHQVYFGFDDSAVGSTYVSTSGECKVQPADDDFPPPQIWEDLNANGLVKGSLIYTRPLASPCYSNWGNWDKATCEAIVKSWPNPYTQYAFYLLVLRMC
jgi:hypothetical protein